MQALIFDYGGTLDTDGRHWAHVLWEGYCEAGMPVTNEQFREAYVYGERALAKAPIVQPEDTFRDVLEKKVNQQFAFLQAEHIWNDAPDVSAEKLNTVVDYCHDYALRFIAKAREVLAVLRPKYRMVLVSNFYGNIETILRDFGLAQYFDAVIESAVVGVRKPDPEIYRLGVKATGCEAKDVTVVGDSYSKDIVPANAIGCRTIWLRGEGWSGEDVGELATYEITSLPDVLHYLS
ncbi:MAG: HAD family hydrolase [Bacteroidaceae bacterium]|nr:HAD family hydrolase [Bacteroidaceae bacterium]